MDVVNGGINHREGWRAGVAVALCLALCELVGCVATVQHLLSGRPCIGRTALVFSTLGAVWGLYTCGLSSVGYPCSILHQQARFTAQDKQRHSRRGQHGMATA